MAQARQQKLKDILRSDPFYSSDTQLDLSAFPTLTPLSDATFEDDRFAPLDSRGAGSGSKELKAFLMRETAEQQGPSVVHVGQDTFRVTFHGGDWNADGEIGGQRHRIRANDRDQLLAKLVQLAKLNAQARPQFRKLLPDEELHVARLAQCDEATAFGQYFLSRIGPQVATMDDPMSELFSNPKYRSVCDEAAFFVWAARTDAYVPDPAFEEMVARVAESKPLNGRLITSIWIQYLDEQQDKKRYALLGQLEESAKPEAANPRETLEQLNELDDASIDRLMHQTRLQSARNFRAGRG